MRKRPGVLGGLGRSCLGAVLFLAAVLSLGACGGSSGEDPPAVEAEFFVTAVAKTPVHPYFGTGHSEALAINSIQGLQLDLVRGVTYRFFIDAPGHPVYLSTDADGGPGWPGRITDGVTNDLVSNGLMTFTPGPAG